MRLQVNRKIKTHLQERLQQLILAIDENLRRTARMGSEPRHIYIRHLLPVLGIGLRLLDLKGRISILLRVTLSALARTFNSATTLRDPFFPQW